MELSPEDDLRLNVLLANDVHAIRIDESNNILYALSAQGEAKVKLNPTGRRETYLRSVRETLSGHVLGSPGGYPIFLRRWTRMGNITSTNLQGLLLLGEPEAVIAVVRSPNLDEELARRAWWALPSSENARRMLERACVAESPIAKELAEFLVEFLPFEENPADTIDSVRLVLQPGLIDDAAKQKLWRMGARKNALRVGFLAGLHQELPESKPAIDLNGLAEPLHRLCEAGNPWAQVIVRSYSEQGQAWIHTAIDIMKKPATQEVVWKLLEAIGDYFNAYKQAKNLDEAAPARLENELEVSHLVANTEQRLNTPEEPLQELLNALPGERHTIAAILTLAQVQGELVTPIFARSSAVGSVMRKQIQPITAPIVELLNRLNGRD